MFGMLEVILRRHPVAGDLRVAGQRLVFVDDLLRRAAHLAVGSGALEHAVDDVAHAAALVVVIVIVVAVAVVSGLFRERDLFDGLMPWSFRHLWLCGARARADRGASRRPDASVHLSDPPRDTRSIPGQPTGSRQHIATLAETQAENPEARIGAAPQPRPRPRAVEVGMERRAREARAARRSRPPPRPARRRSRRAPRPPGASTAASAAGDAPVALEPGRPGGQRRARLPVAHLARQRRELALRDVGRVADHELEAPGDALGPVREGKGGAPADAVARGVARPRPPAPRR